MMARSTTDPPVPARSRSLKSTIEREIKLCVDSGFRLPNVPGGVLLPRRLLTSTYYDTAAHDLAQARITLRLRSERGKKSKATFRWRFDTSPRAENQALALASRRSP